VLVDMGHMIGRWADVRFWVPLAADVSCAKLQRGAMLTCIETSGNYAGQHARAMMEAGQSHASVRMT